MNEDEKSLEKVQPVVPVEQSADSSMMTEEWLKQKEKQVELENRLLLACLKITNESGWVMYGDNPYMMASESEKIARYLGINTEVAKFSESEKDDVYEVTFEGYISNKRNRYYVIESFSSKNKSYAGKSIDEIDKVDVKKKAYSKWLSSGIKRLAGLRNPTLEDLKRAGLKTDKIKKVGFKSSQTKYQKSKSISSSNPNIIQKELPASTSDSGNSELEQKRQDIRRFCLIASGCVPREAGRILKEATKFENPKTGKTFHGVETVDKLSEKQLAYDGSNNLYDKTRELSEMYLESMNQNDAKLLIEAVEKFLRR